MPMCYTIEPGAVTPVTLTTSATPSTAVDDMFVKAGVRNVMLYGLRVGGLGAGLTAISGIICRIVRWTTASTSGTAVTPTPRDPGMQASKCTAAYTPTAGSGGGTIPLAITYGAAGPGGWTAPNPDAAPLLEGGGAHSLDAYSFSGTASLVHYTGMDVME